MTADFTILSLLRYNEYNQLFSSNLCRLVGINSFNNNFLDEYNTLMNFPKICIQVKWTSKISQSKRSE